MSIDNLEPESERLLWRKQLEWRKQASRIPRRAYFAAVCTLSVIFILILTFSVRRPAHFPGDGSDLPDLVLPQPIYNSTTPAPDAPQLEIVISHYGESLPALSETLTRLLRLPSIRALQSTPKITVYTKHPDITLDNIAKSLEIPQDSVHRIPNLGREGGTYLHHLVGNFDTLAEHTLFMQAEPHNERQMLYRLDDYFVSSTGFLSLGFSGKGCAIGWCADEWGWKDVFGHIPGLWGKMYHELPPARRMSLTYKGQFVVSRRRVWGDDKEARRKLLGELREVLEGETSEFSRKDPVKWVEGGKQMEGETADRSAPKFGYVLERMWGLVFNCADGRLVESCPSLWTRREGGGVERCQCLDEIA